MGMEKMRVLACELVYWININTDMKNTVKWCDMYEIPPNTVMWEDNTIKMLHKLQEVVSANMFTTKNNTSYCILDYYKKSLL